MEAMRNSARNRARPGMATGSSASVDDQSGEPAKVSAPSRQRAAGIGGSAKTVRPANSRSMGADLVTPSRVASDNEFAIGGASAKGVEDRIDQAIRASPVVQTLQALAFEQNRSIREILALDSAAQLRIKAAQAPSRTSNDGSSDEHAAQPPPPSEEAAARIAEISSRLADTEAQLERTCQQIASEVSNSKSASHARAVSRQAYGANPLRFKQSPGVDRSQPLISRFTKQLDIEEQFRSKRTGSAKHLEQFFDEEEQDAIRHSDRIVAEERSPESVASRFLDKNGYLPGDDLVDDEDSVLFSSDEESTDDFTATTCSDELRSDSEDEEQDLRLQIIKQHLPKIRRASGSAVKFSCTGEVLRRLQLEDVTIKRPTTRSPMLELIMNNWLRSSFRTVNTDHVCEFLRLMRLLPLEYAVSVYYALVKRILPISKTFFKFLYRCIHEYLPSHRRAFCKAYYSDNKKKKKSSKRNHKPTLKAPTIALISDIVDATGRFYNEYRAYERDHEGFTYKTVFDCLTPAQASDFASQSRLTEGTLAAMDTEAFMETWRQTFGFQHSAPVLAAINAVAFSGNVLKPASWSSYNAKFLNVLNQAPMANRPPGKMVARAFMHNCNCAFLVRDVLAHEPADHTVALDLVLDRLNDSGFLQSDELRNELRGDKRGDAFARGPEDDRLRLPRTARDPGARTIGNNFGARAGGGGAASGSNRPTYSAPSNAVKTNSSSTPKCTRCKREGHTIDSCICKHDVDGVRLEKVDDVVYQARRGRALELAKQKVHAVAASSGSDTEDLEGFDSSLLEQSDHEERDCDGIYSGRTCSIKPCDDDVLNTFTPATSEVNNEHESWFATTIFPTAVSTLTIASDSAKNTKLVSAPVIFTTAAHVPAPSLLNCGDIESNPGPHTPKVLVSMPVYKARRPFEREACEVGARSFLSSVLLYATVVFALMAWTRWLLGVKRHNSLASMFYALTYKPCENIGSAYHGPPSTFRIKLMIVFLSMLPQLAFEFRVADFPPPPRLVGIEPNPGPKTRQPAQEQQFRRRGLPLLTHKWGNDAALHERAVCFDSVSGSQSLAHQSPLFQSPPFQSPQLLKASEGHRADTPRLTVGQISLSRAGGATTAPGSRQCGQPSMAGESVLLTTTGNLFPCPSVLSLSPSIPFSSVSHSLSSIPLSSASSPVSSLTLDDTRDDPQVRLPEEFDENGDYTPAPLQRLMTVLEVTSDSDTSDVEAEVRGDAPCAINSVALTQELLPPPKFIGFLVPPGQSTPPPERSATVCAVDTMCQGNHSVISKSVALALRLPLKACTRTSLTADGGKVVCSHISEFIVLVRIHDHWVSIPATALVWENAAEPVLLSNKLALDSGLIDFVLPNDRRTTLFGTAAFTLDWKSEIEQAEARTLAIYHEDVMDESLDDVVDLSAPLRCGDQDISTLPPDALEYAKKFPLMTKAIPRDAHPKLDKWRAHIRESALPLYSWPASDLKDLKEERLPFKATPLLHKEFDKLIEMHYVEEVRECPTALVMRAQLVSKSKTEKRFCVNGSQQKNVMEPGVFPMPHIRSILAFVASFTYRAKVDCKHGYHNFEVHPDDRRWTTTIGAGRAVVWRKLVQGFASSGAFFQFAITKLLGDFVWKICAVYLDDIIVVGNTAAECAANVLAIMTRLNEYRFRINFAKCMFTPSTDIDFLGFSIRERLVYPGPKVATMLSKILPPHNQPTPKAQRHHLHVFLGCCAYVMQHCPGLKAALAPLYISVTSEPFRYGDIEKQAFENSMVLLSTLQPYHLPSQEDDVTVEVYSDSSGGAGTADDPGAWSIVLGQRKTAFDPANPAEGFELLQLDGGVFNARQATWPIIQKEAYALFQALVRFRQYVFGRRIRVIVDSKVLLHMFRSENNMLKRWYAYIQTFDFEIFHVISEANSLADCLSRYVAQPPLPKPKPVTPLSPFAASRVSAIRHVPAPSLLVCGDVESNPGPSSSDDETPIVFAGAGAATRITPGGGRKARVKSSSHRAATVNRSRKETGKSSGSGSSTRAAQPPVSVPSVGTATQAPVSGAATSDRVIVIDDTPHPSPHASPAHQQEIPEPAAGQRGPQRALLEEWLHTRHVDTGPNAFFHAVSNALHHDTATNQNPRSLQRPFRDRDIREQACWFMETSGDVPLSSTHGLSLSQLWRELKPLVAVLDRDDRHCPDSWTEYRTLVANQDVFADPVIMFAVAEAYQMQIILFEQEGHCRQIIPQHAFRRIFIFATSDYSHFNWGQPVNEEEATHNEHVFNWKFDAPSLSSSPEATVRARALNNLLEISEEHLRWIHEAHSAYTGHPGVEATVKLLAVKGRKWRYMTAQVAQFIKRCPTCCSCRLNLLSAPISASSLRLCSRPLCRWHIDQTGSVAECAYTGYKLFIAFICESTQFCVLYGSRYGTALETAIALIHLMGWLGLAESIHSDGGSENDNYIWHQVQQISGLKHTLSLAYVPESNGIAENNIKAAKRFLRALTVDIGRHNSWGLLLPIAQKSLNDLKREDLRWHSPNDIVFASFADRSGYVIPTFYERRVQEADVEDANAFSVSANFAHRVMCFQQGIVNSFHELHARAFDASSRRNPTVYTDLIVGQAVLIDWPRQTPPTPTHPKKRGPYRVVSISSSHVVLQHFATPPPIDQPHALEWSKAASVYQYADDLAPLRSSADPAASAVPVGVPGRAIDCVLSHHLKQGFDRDNDPHLLRHRVEHQIYECRLYSTDLHPRDHPSISRSFEYNEIKHTFAFDCYAQSHRYLTGHVPVSHMPLNWSPHAVAPSRRPAHPPLPIHEQAIPSEAFSQAFSSDASH